MSVTKSKYSVSKATKGNKVYYLSSRDEANGTDIRLDMKGYTVEAL